MLSAKPGKISLSYKETLSMGIACGSATTMTEGTGLFTKDNVELFI
ncbi:hypothetical protein KB553_09680 [Chryseobacterium rhizoplanae]|nr:hypothetical protein [Chryseobacterium rhizoplanae]UCA61781.1 hypothetical protein KB553_09680 [Chryseobacterium rhizoplanae]